MNPTGTGEVRLGAVAHQGGHALRWTAADGAPVLALDHAVTLEIVDAAPSEVDGERLNLAYDTVDASGTTLRGMARATVRGARYEIRDTWTSTGNGAWRLDREVSVAAAAAPHGFRCMLELRPLVADRSPEAFQLYAPPANYNGNDLDENGIEDYLEARALSYREDRLNLLGLLAFHNASRTAIALSRADAPEFDDVPERRRGQRGFLQRTDIGSLGFRPEQDGALALFAAYPFVERDRCNALLVKERLSWGAFWPADGEDTLAMSYLVEVSAAVDLHEATWTFWRRRFAALAPSPIRLLQGQDRIAEARLRAAMAYYVEEADAPHAAGIVTNCHPQDGRQISNVIQFGFTGQNTLMALNFLRTSDGDPERRRRALRIVDFFLRSVSDSPAGLCRGLYNTDRRRYGDWWTGLLLPLAYAEPGADLERLMGPVHQLLAGVIRDLGAQRGLYLRCAAEEYEPLLRAYELEKTRGVEHPDWLAACEKFGRFLAAAQAPDGSWRRAYTLDGQPLTEPRTWFGQTDYQQKSSTATVVPFLLGLDRVSGDRRWRDAAIRAGRFVREPFVERMRHNGGIHDSIYAKPQLVDGESIIFVARALLDLHRATAEMDFLEGAIRAGRLVASWICLWDVPLPPSSTLARHGFRSTGWFACDTPGAGYVHPMGMLAVPLLVELGLLASEPLFLRAAELVQQGCSETVAMPGKDWGYAADGLQEEGLLLSWWFADDPMFSDTAFGSRGKGEGNKTCLPWIAAVGAGAHLDLVDRYGTAEIGIIAERHRPAGALHGTASPRPSGSDAS